MRCARMSKKKEKSRFKIENPLALSFATFYLISAAVFFYSLINDPNMVHVGLIGILSLITAFGVFRREKWSVWLAFLVFCIGNAFSITLLLNPLTAEVGGTTLEAALIIYLIIIWISIFYLIAKREEFS